MIYERTTMPRRVETGAVKHFLFKSQEIKKAACLLTGKPPLQTTTTNFSSKTGIYHSAERKINSPLKFPLSNSLN
jgi:hypothetical protein